MYKISCQINVVKADKSSNKTEKKNKNTKQNQCYKRKTV